MQLRFAVLTVSDRSFRGERDDLAGPALRELIAAQGWQVVEHRVVADEQNAIADVLRAWSDPGSVDIIATTGGTGFAPRDVTPEATRQVIEREAPGLAEAMRAAGAAKSRHAMLSRAIAGIRRRTLILNLPGSPKAAVENLDAILPALEHAVALLRDERDAEAGHQG